MTPLPEDLDPAIWADFLTHRKAMKAPINTQTAVTQTARELEKARADGWTPDEAIAETISAGWRGVKAEYLKNRKTGGRDEASQRSSKPTSAVDRVRAANGRAGYGRTEPTRQGPRTIHGERVG